MTHADSRAAALTKLIQQLRRDQNYAPTFKPTMSRSTKVSADQIKRDLGTASVAHRCQEHKDVSCVVSFRRNAKLRLVSNG